MSKQQKIQYKAWDTVNASWYPLREVDRFKYIVEGHELFFNFSNSTYYRMLDHLCSDLFSIQELHREEEDDELSIYLPGMMSFRCGNTTEISLGELYKSFSILIPHRRGPTEIFDYDEEVIDSVPTLFIYDEVSP